MTEQQLNTLIQKYLSGSATEKERKKVEQWYESFDAFGMEIDKEKQDASFLRSWKRVKDRIEEDVEKEEVLINKTSSHKVLYRWVAVAAMLVLISGTVYFLMNQTQGQENNLAQQVVKKDFKPGGNKAILTLGNGQKVVLDSSNTGLVSMQGNTKVLKLNKGLLSYVSTSSTGHSTGLPAGASAKVGSTRQAGGRWQEAGNKNLKITFNTISTPRGGKYEIVLPDGSKVWLNAASSLRFPTSFSGKKRIVEMTGEAYFEIAQNEKQPFVVKKGKTEVKVLGTHFNVMAYDNEETMKVTLLEGAVKVSQDDVEKILKPGEDADIKGNGIIEVRENQNINQTMAWKNDLFWFENSNMQEIVKQLARWYDVDIEIKGNITDHFTGSIPKSLTFSKVFEVLQKTGRVHYEIENNKKVVVSP